MKAIHQLPVVLTSFAYREEYFPELDGMIATAQKHHPEWQLVTGRGPISDTDNPILDVESPSGKFRWRLPVPLDLDGSENDWLRIVLMKAWWVAQVWHEFGNLIDLNTRRVVWLDADARLNGPLDIMLESEEELVAGPWGGAEGTPDDHMCSGFLVFQGAGRGVVESIIDQWSATCLSYIRNLPPPSPLWPYGEGDQEVLTTVLRSQNKLGAKYRLVKLDFNKYCGEPNYREGTPRPEALIDQWMMNEKMRYPKDRNRSWPPPEPARRKSPL